MQLVATFGIISVASEFLAINGNQIRCLWLWHRFDLGTQNWKTANFCWHAPLDYCAAHRGTTFSRKRMFGLGMSFKEILNGIFWVAKL